MKQRSVAQMAIPDYQTVMSETEIERLWLDEAMHPDDDLDRGLAKAYPAQEVLDRARSRLK